MMLSFDLSICALSSGGTAPFRIRFVAHAPLTTNLPVGFVIGVLSTEPPGDIAYTLTDDDNSNLELVGNEIRVGGALAVGRYRLAITAASGSVWSQTFLQEIEIEDAIPGWVPRDHLGAAVALVLDAQNDRGWYGDAAFSSEASLLAGPGVSGAAVSGVRTFGPHDIPGAANEFPGAADMSALGGIGVTASPAAVAIVNGELELTTTGIAGQGWRIALPVAKKAYRWRLRGRRGSATSGNIAPTSALNAGMTGGTYSRNTVFGAVMSDLSVVIPGSSNAGSPRYAGARQQNGAAGTYYFDDAVLTEVKPFSLYNQAEGTIVVEGVADAAGADQVLFEVANTLTGQSGDRDHIRVTRAAATGEISVSLLSNQVTFWSQSLGAVADSAPIRIALSWKESGVVACLNGSPRHEKPNVGSPVESHAVMRFGGSVTGQAWSGFRKGYYIPRLQPNWWIQHASTGFADTDVWTEGDSYTNGAHGVSLSGALRTASGRVVINSAVGGSTLADILARLQGEPNARGRTLVIWDGSANGHASVANTCNLIDRIIAWHGTPSRIVYVPSVAVGPSADGIKTSYTGEMEAIRDHIANTGIHTFDPVPLINALAAGSAQDLKDISAGVVCQSLLLDAVHLTQAAMTAVAEDVEAMIVAGDL
jgi:hypothetical protein